MISIVSPNARNLSVKIRKSAPISTKLCQSVSGSAASRQSGDHLGANPALAAEPEAPSDNTNNTFIEHHQREQECDKNATAHSRANRPQNRAGNPRRYQREGSHYSATPFARSIPLVDARSYIRPGTAVVAAGTSCEPHVFGPATTLCCRPLSPPAMCRTW